MSESKMSIKRATLINSAAKYYNVVCSFAVNIILSRILSPAEYGVVAIVTVFITFFSLFSDLGFGVAYIQNNELDNNDKNNLFTFLIYVGILLFLLFYVFAYGIAWFYGDNLYIKVSQLLGVNLFLTAVNVIPYSDLLKQQRFMTAGIVQAIGSTIAAVCAVVLAKHGLSYYSIVFQSLTNTFIQCITFIFITRTRFLVKVNVKSIKKVLGFSLGQIGFNTINYFSRNLDNLLIGKVFGSASLGYYDKAYKTSTYPVSNFSSIIGSSIQPVLSKHQDDRELVYDKFKKTFLFLVVIGAYLSVALNLASREVILVLYGNQWEKSVVAFSFLALSLFAQMSLNITGAFYQVLNNTRLLAFAGGASAVLIVSGISAGLIIGTIEAVSIGYLIAQCVNFVVILWIMSKYLFRKPVAYISKELLKILFVSILLFFVCRSVFNILTFENLVLSLVFKILVVTIVDYALLYVTRLEKYVLSIILPKYNRK